MTTPDVADAADDQDPTTWAGYRAHTRARSTGTLVAVCTSEGQGFSADEGGKYILICEDSGCLHHNNLAEAKQLMRHPEDWCPYCQEKARAVSE